jgi:chorismate synthase
MSNSFGKKFVLTTFGESHGVAIGGIIDGMPSNFPIDFEAVQLALDRRKPGQSAIVSQRKESDEVEFISGIFEGRTTGSPIGFLIKNKDAKSKDYEHIKDKFRPGHADFTYSQKYGIRDYRGGGRSSARETACRVVAGAIAAQWLKAQGIEVSAWVSQVGIFSFTGEPSASELNCRWENPVRGIQKDWCNKVEDYIKEIRKEGDTVGGIVSGKITGVPTGLGEPVFDKLHARLAYAIMGINAVKGFDYGKGFESAFMQGSQYNDIFQKSAGKIVTKTNNSGGIQGGISNGHDIDFSVAFRPVSTLMRDQPSVNEQGSNVTVKGKGRHDPCVVPRAVPIVEAMAALVIMDFLLLNKAR